MSADPSLGPAGAMWLSLLLLLLLVVPLLAVLCKGHLRPFAGSSPNPFSEDVRRPSAPLVTDKEARKKVLKQGQREGLQGCTWAASQVCVPIPTRRSAAHLGLSFPICKVLGGLP